MECKVSIDKITTMRIGTMAQVKIHGDLVNEGNIEVKNRGVLEIARNTFNNGNITIDDPITYKEIVIEALKTTGNVTEFGTQILKKLNLL